MKILFVVEIHCKLHKVQSELILDSLKSFSHPVEVLVSGKINVETNFVRFLCADDLEENCYDLVIVFNKNALKTIAEYVTREKLPLIYLLNANEISLQFPDELKSISKIILINNFGKNAGFLFPKSLVSAWYLIEKLPEISENVKPNVKSPKLLVYIEEKESRYPYVLQLIPMFNLWVRMRIIVITKETDFPIIHSSHITIKDFEKTNLADEIKNSDIVLGNGANIEKAIGLCKPCIIIGERGFGGIVIPDNFKSRFNNGFLGRLGGELNEYIPERVIWDSVLDILDWDVQKYREMLTENYNLLQNHKSESEKLFLQLMYAVLKKHQNIEKNITETKLTVSGIFGLAQATKEKYVLVNKATRQIYANIEKEETEIIGLFNEPCTIGNALARSEYISEPEEFNAFVTELANEKILEIYED